MPEEKKEEPKEEIKFVFPALDNGPSVCYENDKKEIWIGIPLSKVGNPFYLLAAIDGAKVACLRYLDIFVNELKQKEQFKISPTGKHINGVMKDLFDKSKSLVGLGKA